MLGRINVKVFATTSIIVALLWVTFQLRIYQRPIKHHEPEPPPVEVPRFEFQGIKYLQDKIDISRIHLQANPSRVALKEKLPNLPPFHPVNLESPSLPDATNITIPIPPLRQPPDASSLIFGLATTLDRMKEAANTFSRWASNTNAQFVVIVEPGGLEKLNEVLDLYKSKNISLTLIESIEDYLDRYVRLLGVLHDHVKTHKWAIIIDDDTFFPSMTGLLRMLAKHDPNESLYIGGMSENKFNIDHAGISAIGGAGIILSVPLLRQLYPHADECVKLPDNAGDARIATCIYTYTTVKLTWEHDLYQLDLHGDVTGFYEAVRSIPISVHHWKSWHHHDMELVSEVSKICGQECVFQKYQFADGWLMTNGFSIVKYTTEPQNGAMEHTWKETIWDIPDSWTYTLGPLMAKDEGKIQYLLEKVEETKQSMTLYYVRRKDGIGESIIEAVWSR